MVQTGASLEDYAIVDRQYGTLPAQQKAQEMDITSNVVDITLTENRFNNVINPAEKTRTGIA